MRQTHEIDTKTFTLALVKESDKTKSDPATLFYLIYTMKSLLKIF